MTSPGKKLWKNDTFQTAIVVILIVGIVFGVWFGSQIVLNTKIPPALAVVSGSMCIPYDGACDGLLSFDHPFERTLHKGDIIIIQGVDPKDLNTNYPESDIIVFHNPYLPSELIVHRIIGSTIENGTLYFRTKGDGNGNGNPWPQAPVSGLDRWDSDSPPGVPENLVVGKVIMRIPWIGWIAIKMQEMGASNSTVVPIIVILIILLIIIEFVPSMLKRKKAQTPQTESNTTQTQI